MIEKRVIISDQKVVVVGSYSVGKTTLVTYLTTEAGSYLTRYDPTMTINVYTWRYEDQNYLADIFLWDFPGQKSFKRIRVKDYQDADAIIIIYDVTRDLSFLEVEKWYNEIWDILKDKSIPFFIILPSPWLPPWRF